MLTYCKANSKNSAMSSTYHSGKAENAGGTVCGNGNARYEFPGGLFVNKLNSTSATDV